MGLATFNRYRRIAEEHGAKGLDQLNTKFETERPEPGAPVHPFTNEIPEQPQIELPDHPEQQPQPGVVPQTQPYTIPPSEATFRMQPNFTARTAEQEEVAKVADARNIEAQKAESQRNQRKLGEEGKSIQEQEAQVANVPDENTPVEPVGEPAPSQTEKDNATAEEMMAADEEDDTEETDGEEPAVRRKRGRPRKNPTE